VFLLDFACYKPPENLKVCLDDFMKGSRASGVRPNILSNLCCGILALFTAGCGVSGFLDIRDSPLFLMTDMREVQNPFVWNPAGAVCCVQQQPFAELNTLSKCLHQERLLSVFEEQDAAVRAEQSVQVTCPPAEPSATVVYTTSMDLPRAEILRGEFGIPEAHQPAERAERGDVPTASATFAAADCLHGESARGGAYGAVWSCAGRPGQDRYIHPEEHCCVTKAMPCQNVLLMCLTRNASRLLWIAKKYRPALCVSCGLQLYCLLRLLTLGAMYGSVRMMSCSVLLYAHSCICNHALLC